MDEHWNRLIEALLNYKGRIFGAIVGFVAGLIVINYGWIQALFFLFCLGTGYYIGKLVDGKNSIRQILEKILPPVD
ncbi:MAG TPA: DUF2273 domain-containing protein [Bacillota bacterium]|jgi:uncharacterized membrane protein|nr:DUF2273 domain-containing protein [Bacillota bacterium]